jgi:hypothetical protein
VAKLAELKYHDQFKAAYPDESAAAQREELRARAAGVPGDA